LTWGGGFRNLWLPSISRADTLLEQWKSTEALAAPREGSFCALLPEGKVRAVVMLL
jgi:hypothetical protein